jgi:hypothetical protein
MRALRFLAVAVFLTGCSQSPKAPPEQASAAPSRPKPADESRRFSKQGLLETTVVDNAIWGKAFMPGGTTAKYKNHEAFVARLPSATDAAFLLLDWKKELKDAKLIPSFGGYAGTDNGAGVFVFTKGEWIAGIRGLNQKRADTEARILAAQLN